MSENLEILLRRHDWNYRWCDSVTDYDRGRRQVDAIREAVDESDLTSDQWRSMFKTHCKADAWPVRDNYWRDLIDTYTPARLRKSWRKT